MKHIVTLVLNLLLCQFVFAQEWALPIQAGWFKDVITVDGGECILGIGGSNGSNDGFILKVDKEGVYSQRSVHLSGMILCYHSAVQLEDGNYMVFGICDDSLCDPHYQHYLRADVFDGQLDLISSKTFSVADSVFDCFSNSDFRHTMQSILSKTGTVILAAVPSHYDPPYGSYSALRFYEFDAFGDTIRTVDNPISMCRVASIKEITYEPHSDNLMIVINGGVFGYDSGIPGIYVADADLNIIAHQSMLHLGGAQEISDNACEGRWFDDNRIIMDCEQYIGSSFTYHTLYVADSALNVYAELRLPPYDSCTWVPKGSSTAYINDSTIFAFSYCSERMFSVDEQQVNVILVDKHLNLLGRKVLKKENAMSLTSSPAAFNDGGCAVLVTIYNGQYYPGPAFCENYLMKFRREDIEITWDIIEEENANKTSVYPNPTHGIINIPLDIPANVETRIQIFDIMGAKCLDCAINKSGNLITLDTQNIESGLYLYKVVSGNVLLSEGKFVKE